MFDPTDGCRSMLLMLLTVVVIICGFVLGVGLINLGHGADNSEAARLNAQAQLEAQRQENWERRYIMWTTSLAAFSHDWTCAVVGGALIAASAGVALLVNRWPPPL